MGIPFSLTSNKYDDKTYASYMPSGWYKSLLRFMSTPIFALEITEDYKDLPVLQEREVYLMKAFVDSGIQNADLKSLILSGSTSKQSLLLILPLRTVVASLIIHMKDWKATTLQGSHLAEGTVKRLDATGNYHPLEKRLQQVLLQPNFGYQ